MPAPPEAEPPASPEAEARLTQVLWSLREHLGHLILIGGWVPYLHRRYGAIPDWRTDPIFTTELDFMIETRGVGDAGGRLPDVLRAAGFRPVGDGPAVVWRREGEPERIEFFVEHRGSGRDLGSVRNLGGGLGALSLHGLRLLAESTVCLDLPLGRATEDGGVLAVPVPRLGAFVVQKADSFPRRREDVKQVKDLFYLVEIAAAGDRVQEHIAREAGAIADARGPDDPALTAARHNLAAVVRPGGSLRRLLTPLAEMVAARYHLQPPEARARTAGFLQDVLEILR